MDRQSLGKRGEELAARFLIKKGLKIFERNFHTRWGELDIVAEEGGTVVFAEVKARSNVHFARPEVSVTHTKQQHLRKAAELWLLENYPNELPPCRFDVISIVLGDDGEETIEHFPDAF